MSPPPYPLPLIFCSWGFRHGADWWNGADDLATRCIDAKIPTVAVQLGVDEHGWRNTERADADALRARGLHVAVWGVANVELVRTELERLGATDADWLPQVEGVYQLDPVLDAALKGLRARAIVTTYSGAGGESPDQVDQLHAAGVSTALVECYAADAARHADLDVMLWQGTQYGWGEDELFAVMGTYRGETPDDYQGTDSIGRDFGLYLAEPMSSSQWHSFAALNPPQPRPPEPPDEGDDNMEPVTDQQGRDAIGFAVQAAAQNWGTDEKPRARLSVCRRIAQAGNDDPKWNACRDAVVSALDAAGVPK